MNSVAYYRQKAIGVRDKLRAKGVAVTFVRPTAGTVDLAKGSVTPGVPLTTSSFAVILPSSSGTVEAFDNRLEDKSLAKKRFRFLKVAAYGMTFTPASLDQVSFAGSNWQVLGNTPVDPTGSQPLIYGVGVYELGPTPEPEPTP